MAENIKQRNNMVRRQVVARGIRDRQVIAAMKKVPRDAFVPEAERWRAYRDRPLSIGRGQTISQPYIVAFMVEALELRGGETVLEIGAGSGYAAAVLAEIAGEVFTLERIGLLAEKAAIALREAGYRNVYVKHADGSHGWPDAAPFDAVLVSACAATVPLPLRLQLKVGGRLVIPVGCAGHEQHLMRVRRISRRRFARETLEEVQFVPLVRARG
jgi:protein-L-isoaspartate(D-aspartate) O-methyltransferase